ncbi:MAG TPA: hypothetical protein VHH73_01900 [Verrucomicrobiae bacterium]|nr:hypothetical protein [Verrucomicrobiae bacterium]
MPPIHDPRILNAIYAGEKISAIKLYRDAYPGMDLSQAKDAVEALEEELRRQAPEQFRGGASPTGIPASGNPEVVRAIYAGEKIAAIRLYREANPGIGLKEA